MPTDHYLNLLLNFSLGAVVAAYGSLVGAGGGFLLVPAFLLLHKLPHEQAVGTSLAIVTANALSGTVGYVWARRIDYRSGALFALFTFPGAIVGGMLTSAISGPAFNRVFGGLLGAVALYLFLRKPRRSDPGKAHRPNLPLGCFFSVLVGMVSSWFGIGGGIIHVPLMTEVLGFPVHIAVATSHFILGFTALAGTMAHLHYGHVNLAVAVPAGLGALLGAQLGVWLSRRTKEALILRILSLALLGVAIRLLLS